MSDGAVLEEVLGRGRTEATLIDDRQDGQGLILLQSTGRAGGAPLLRWDGRGELRQITDGIIVAAW